VKRIGGVMVSNASIGRSCRAMTHFGIFFNSDLKFVSVLSNVDRKYYQCMPKKR
jgi:hypothetical protein